jgi:Cu+-exporting ATPase
MHCSLCAGIVERALHSQPGVDKVSISLPSEQVLVEYDPRRVSREQLLEAVDSLGFTVGESPALRGAESSDEDARLVSEGRRLLILIALSAVTVPLMLFELVAQVGSWVGWALAGLAVASLVVAPELFVVTVQSRLRGLLEHRPVVRASAFGGVAGGLVGLVFGLEEFPTGSFFAAPCWW